VVRGQAGEFYLGADERAARVPALVKPVRIDQSADIVGGGTSDGFQKSEILAAHTTPARRTIKLSSGGHR
jgi:hypothetical protein